MQRFFHQINQLVSIISSDTKESIAKEICARFKASLTDKIAATDAQYAEALRSPTTSLTIFGWDDFKQSLNTCLTDVFIRRLNASNHHERAAILSAINDKLIELAGANSRMDIAKRYQRGIYHHHRQYHTISLRYTLPAIDSNLLSPLLQQINEKEKPVSPVIK